MILKNKNIFPFQRKISNIRFGIKYNMKEVKSEKKKYSQPIGIYILLLIISIPACLPLIKNGFYEPHDLHHLADIYEMHRSISLGQLPPRLAPDFLYNLGYPLFNFYYVLPFYLGAFLFSLGFSLTTTFKGVFLISVFLSIIGMYKFLRLNFSKWASLAGSTLYLYTSYRAVQIYVRGAIGEALALAILPWVLWIMIKIIILKNIKLVGIGSIILFFFIIAHNYLWFIFLPVAFLLLLFVPDIRKSNGWWKRLGISAILGFLLSSYWLASAILERKYINRLTPFLLEDHFPFIKQLVIPSWGYGSSVWGPGDEISFQIGIVNLLAVLLGAIFIVKLRGKKDKKYAIGTWAFLGFFASVFMMNIRSMPLWKLIPFYNFIQFPWRLLFLTTLFSSVLLAFSLDCFKKRYLKIFSVILMLLSVLTAISYFNPNKIVFRSDDDYMTRMFATKRIKQDTTVIPDEHKNWSEDYLLLPNWSEEKPTDVSEDFAEIIKGKGKLNIEKISDVNYVIDAVLESPSDINFNKLYFPGWFVYVDDEKYETETNKPIGSVKIVDVPRGQHNIELIWKETNMRLVFDLLSCLSLALVLFIYFKGNEFKKIREFATK